MGLRGKFNAVMLAGFVVGLGLIGAFSYTVVNADARSEVLEQARLMAEQAAAVRGYTDSDVGPLLEAKDSVRFLPQTIPSFSSQAVFKGVHARYPEYAYHEAALNPTNPADRATDWQADIIADFQRDPARAELAVERDTPSGRTLNFARPLKVDDAACLVCHSVPQAAPASMIDLYGPDHGFGWKLNDVVAAQIVTVPMQVAFDRANRSFALVMGGFTVIFAALLLILNVMLHTIIIRPVRRMSAAANEVSMGNMDAPDYKPAGDDEIAQLGASFSRMRRSLADAMRMIEQAG